MLAPPPLPLDSLPGQPSADRIEAVNPSVVMPSYRAAWRRCVGSRSTGAAIDQRAGPDQQQTRQSDEYRRAGVGQTTERALVEERLTAGDERLKHELRADQRELLVGRHDSRATGSGGRGAKAALLKAGTQARNAFASDRDRERVEAKYAGGSGACRPGTQARSSVSRQAGWGGR